MHQINKIFINILFFHYSQNVFVAGPYSFAGWMNGFADQIWSTGYSLETPDLDVDNIY